MTFIYEQLHIHLPLMSQSHVTIVLFMGQGERKGEGEKEREGEREEMGGVNDKLPLRSQIYYYQLVYT